MRTALLALALLLAVFHRPLLHALIRTVALKIAAHGHIRLGFEIEGPVFTHLILKNVRAEPLPGGLSPVETIRIERVRLDYSLARLARRGSREFLKNCEIKNANVVLRPTGEPQGPRHPFSVAGVLRDFFTSPMLMSDRASIENATFVVRGPEGDLVLRGLNALLDPAKPGWLRLDRLQIPNGRAWEKIDATTSFTRPHLILRGLALDERVRFERIDLNAPSDAAKKWRLEADAKFFGGEGACSLMFDDHGKAPRAEVRGSAKNFSLEELSRYFKLRTEFAGTVRDLLVEASGDPDVPATWSGGVRASAEPLVVGKWKLDRGTATVEAREGIARLRAAEFVLGENKLLGQASVPLPQRLQDFAAARIDGGAHLSAPKLPQIADTLTGGAIEADTKFNLHGKKFTATVTASASDWASSKFTFRMAGATLQFTKFFDSQQKQTTFFDGLEGELEGSFKELRVGDYAADSGAVKAGMRGPRLHVGQLEIARAGNTIEAHGDCDLPRDPKAWAAGFFDAEFSIHAPRVTAFNAEPKLTGLNGHLDAEGHVTHRETYEGAISATGSDLVFQELSAEKLNVRIGIEKSVATVQACDLTINATDHVAAHGRITLDKPFDYDGTLGAHVKNLAIFQPLLRVSGNREPLTGSLAFDWSGRGTAAPPAHVGEIKLDIRKARYGAIEITGAKLGGSYLPEAAEFPDLHIVSNEGAFDGSLEILEGKLRLHDMKFQRGSESLTGYVILPIDLTKLGGPGLFPLDQRIAAVVNATSLNIEKVVGSFGKQSPVTGTVTANLFAGGTLTEPTGHLKLAARNLKSKAQPKIEPTDIDLNLHFSQNELTLAATAKQRQLQPIDARGKMQFDIRKTITARQIDPQTPLDLKINLPKSQAAALAQFAPIIRYVEGQMAFDARLAGTIAKPQLSGAVTLDLPAVRLRDPSMPAVNGFKIDLRFTEARLSVERFNGEVSGGPFSLAGKIGFEKLDTPTLDLRFRSQNLLIARNESLTVRADSDLKIAGPFNAASVTGNAALTKSRFVRDVEILPIELPGRPAPKPRQTEAGFSLKPPFADWKFDVAIKTKDPFLIRGNLTNGSGAADLKLGGTGSAPTLDGMVRLDNLVAALPFSKLEISRGFAYFSADEPFEPKLDIQGSSSIRDYNISVYIFGTASQPQTILSSEPPLPQDEIVSLLATGTTRKELTGSGDVLAGRAAVLAFQELYRKVFKRKPTGNNDSFMGRFALDMGAVDPRTGKQEISTRFKLGENFYLIGDVDVQGDVRGQVKYLMRFR